MENNAPLPPEFEKIVSVLPAPLAIVVFEYLQLITEEDDTSHYTALHRMCDAVEIMLRFFASLLMAELIMKGDFPQKIKDLLVDQIERPSMGSWAVVINSACEELQDKMVSYPEVLQFANYNLLDLIYDKRQKGLQSFLTMRNNLAHSGRVSDLVAKDWHDAFRPRFLDLCENLMFLENFCLIALCEGNTYSLTGYAQQYPEINEFSDGFFEEGVLIFIKKNANDSAQGWRLNIFPLASYDILTIENRLNKSEHIRCFQIYSRYNKKYLEYTILSDKNKVLKREKENALKRFNNIFQLEVWKANRQEQEYRAMLSQEYNFQKDIKQLTVDFFGRTKELADINQWLKNNQTGICWVEGKPGTGKSAFIAKLIKELQKKSNLKEKVSWGLFSERKQNIENVQFILVPFFFSKNYFYGEFEFIEALITTIQEWQAKLGIKTRTLDRKKENIKEYQEQVKQLLYSFSQLESTVVGDKKKLIIIVDGIDELGETESSTICRYAVENRFPGILWVISSRNKPSIFNQSMECTLIFEPNGIPKFSEREIRTYLENYSEFEKYRLFARDDKEGNNPFIDAVVTCSEGLPVYLKLLIEEIRQGNISFEDERILPAGLDDFYGTSLEKISKGDFSRILPLVIVVFAFCQEPLSNEMVKQILHNNFYVKKKSTLVDQVVDLIDQFLDEIPLTGNSSFCGKMIYHNTFREFIRNSSEYEITRLEIATDIFPSIEEYIDGDSSVDITGYAIRQLPKHLLEAVDYAQDLQETLSHINNSIQLLTNNTFIFKKVSEAGLLYDLVLDYSHLLKKILYHADLNKESDDIRQYIVTILNYDFSAIKELDIRETLCEFWHDAAAEELSAYLTNNPTVGCLTLDFLFRQRGNGCVLSRIALRAATYSQDYDFLLKVMKYEASVQMEKHIPDSSPEEDDYEEELINVSRWITDALFVCVIQAIGGSRWEKLDQFLSCLVQSLRDIVGINEKQTVFTKLAACFKIAMHRKAITVHVKSILDVVYRLMINYSQNPLVLSRLNKFARDVGEIIYQLPLKEIAQIPGVANSIYKLVYVAANYKWKKISENSRNEKNIEETLEIKSNHQEQVLEEYKNLILVKEYDARKNEGLFEAIAGLAFRTGLTCSSDEMYQVNRGIHGHLLYHMQKKFPEQFINQYVRRYFIGTGQELVDSFTQPLQQYSLNDSEANNRERVRGLYDMLLRFLTYEAMDTNTPEKLMTLNEELIRHIIETDLELFNQEFNIVGRPLHILTALTLAEARCEDELLPRTIKIMEDLRDGKLAVNATAEERWEAISKCYFDLLYAGRFQVKHVLNSLDSMANLAELSQLRLSHSLGFAPTIQELDCLFVVNSASARPAVQTAMKKAAGRLAVVMLALKYVNRDAVELYFKKRHTSKKIWTSINRWASYIEQQYPAPSGKRFSIEQTINKYYEQMAVGLFVNFAIMNNCGFRQLLADIFTKMIDLNKERKGMGKNELKALLWLVFRDIFKILRYKDAEQLLS